MAEEVFEAVKTEDPGKLRKALEKVPPPPLNVIDKEDDVTPLQIAVMTGSLENVKLLLDAGADPNFTKETILPPFLCTGTRTYITSGDIVRLLASKGADVNYTTKDGSNVLHFFVTNFIDFFYVKDISAEEGKKIVKSYFEALEEVGVDFSKRNSDTSDTKYPDGKYPDGKLAYDLLKWQNDNSGTISIGLSAFSGNTGPKPGQVIGRYAESLLFMKMPLNDSTKPIFESQLLNAMANGDIEMTDALFVKGVRPPKMSKKFYEENKDRIQQIASNLKLVRHLLEKGVPVAELLPVFEFAVLYATQAKDIELLDTLFGKGVGFSASDRTFVKDSPLLIAINIRDKVLIKYFLDKGYPVDEVNPEHIEMAKKDHGMAIAREIHLAVQNRDEELIKVLLARGASVKTKWYENSVLGIALLGSDNVNILNMLLDAGADVNPASGTKVPTTPREKKTIYDQNRGIPYNSAPLIIAIDKSRWSSLKVLLDRGADPNLRVPYGTALVFSLLRASQTAINIILAHPSTNLYARNDLPGFGEGTVVDYARAGRFHPFYNDLILNTAGPHWRGFSRADIANLNSIFFLNALERNDFSLCPVCLKFSHRIEGCLYMHHNCKAEAGAGYYNKPLYEKYKNDEGNIFWCTCCGRIALGHRHYMPSEYHHAPMLMPPNPAPDPFEEDCSRTNGGGGPFEKFVRFDRLRVKAKELMGQIGVVADEVAKRDMVHAMWTGIFGLFQDQIDAYRLKYQQRMPTVSIINFPTNLPNLPPIPVRTIERPLVNRELMPEFHPVAEGLINSYMGAPADVIQFHHRRGDGTVNDHIGDYISKDGLEAFLEGVIASKGERLGYCWNPLCTAMMHPDEVKPFVDEDVYKRYVEAFNRKFSGAQGGGKKTRRKQRGGNGATKPTANSVFQEVKYPQCYLPRKTGKKNNKRNTRRRK